MRVLLGRPEAAKNPPAGSVALQAQGQATQGRSLSTLAPLRALPARTPVPAWARRAVGEGVKSCPRDGCGKSARPVRSSIKRMVENVLRVFGLLLDQLSKSRSYVLPSEHTALST